MAASANREPSPHFGALQDVVDSLFPSADDDPAAAVLARAGLGPTVRRLDIVLAADAADLPDELREVVALLPPGDYTRQRLCVQLNSAIGGHAWGQVYGTVE